METIIATSIILFIFLMFSILLLNGKGAMLIAGYNTLDEKERAKYDEKALCKAVGKLILSICGAMLFFIYGEIIKQQWPQIVGTILIVVFMVGGMFYINVGSRFKKVD